MKNDSKKYYGDYEECYNDCIHLEYSAPIGEQHEPGRKGRKCIEALSGDPEETLGTGRYLHIDQGKETGAFYTCNKHLQYCNNDHWHQANAFYQSLFVKKLNGW